MEINIKDYYLQLSFDRLIPRTPQWASHNWSDIYTMIDEMHGSLCEFNKENWDKMSALFSERTQYFIVFVNFLHDIGAKNLYDSDNMPVGKFINEFIKTTYLIPDDSQQFVAHAVIGVGTFFPQNSKFLTKENMAYTNTNHTEVFILKTADIIKFLSESA